MALVIGVRFKRMGKVYFFDPGDLTFIEGDGVIVETVRGIEYGDVVMLPKEVSEQEIVAPLKPVIRVATDEDKRQVAENEVREREALAIGSERILEHQLDMKLVDVEYTFDGRKIVFYFTSDGRVDFRNLVRDLAARFRTRIELRQIGVRDEAKMLGGLGPCGRIVCCKSFMNDFVPVSIRMAKDQNISLNPTKISGLCGRLMCCLQFEHETYVEARKRLPKVGACAITADGPGEISDINIPKERIKVRVTLPDLSLDLREYSPDEIQIVTREERDAAVQHLQEKAPVVTPRPHQESRPWQKAKAARAQEQASAQEQEVPPKTDGSEQARPAKRDERPRNRPRRRAEPGADHPGEERGKAHRPEGAAQSEQRPRRSRHVRKRGPRGGDAPSKAQTPDNFSDKTPQ